MAHKKGVGSSRNGRDSNPNYLGVKRADGQFVNAGTIILRQLDRADMPIYEVELIEAFPEALSGFSLDTSSSAIQTFDVTLAVVSTEGCKHDTTFIAAVEIFSNPIADFSASTFTTTELLSEIEFYNNSSGAISYFWDFDNAVVSTEENPIIDFEQAKNYEVILNVVSAEGCESEMTKIVHILPEYALYAPNSFTPNGDGNNDVFLAEGNGVTSFEMQVFDRWGGLVFESSDIESGWDGLDASANTVGVGTYMYHISLYDYNGKLWIYNGELNLMR